MFFLGHRRLSAPALASKSDDPYWFLQVGFALQAAESLQKSASNMLIGYYSEKISELMLKEVWVCRMIAVKQGTCILNGVFVMEEIFRITPIQKVLSMNMHRHPEGCNYNGWCCSAEGALDPIRLQAALNALVQDHVLLNSHIHERNGELYWRRNDAIHPCSITRTARC